MLEDVLVAVVFVDLQLQGRNFREDDVRKTGFDQRLKAGARTVGEQQFGQFVAHTLGGYDVDAVAHRGNRLGRVRRDTEAQLGHESHGAHHTQRIVVKGLSRIHRRAQHALDRSLAPPNGSTNCRSGTRRAIALTVKSRRDRSPSSVSP